MIEFIKENTWNVPLLVAVIGLLAAIIKRKKVIVHRHETAPQPGTDTAQSNASPQQRNTANTEIYKGVNTVGEFLCIGNDSIHRSTILNVKIAFTGMTVLGGPFMLLLGLGFLTDMEDASIGDWIAPAICILLGLFGMNFRRVSVQTTQGSKVIAKDATSGEAKKIRDQLLRWLS
jgi:hypothetical protein